MITPGQQHDVTTAPALLEGIPARHVLGDKAYDSGALRALIKTKRAKAVIPSTGRRRKPIPHDRTIYRKRNQIERCINRLKHFRRFATRYDRRASRFLAFIHLACAMQWAT